MNPAYLAPLANHVWQSTVFAAAAGLLTLALRNNPARVRHWVWLAASCKFLVPLSVLIALGGQVRWRTAFETPVPNFSIVLDQVSQPFAAPALRPTLPVAPAPASPLPAILLAIWACGFLGIACSWWVRWRRIRAAVRGGSPLQLAVPIRVVSSGTLLEPGVFGIFRPVLALPEGIFENLTPAQLQAVIEHELCHVRRRDNLIAAIHMFVESVFWFHPLVWWMGKRMIEERERACDEEVLQRGTEPRTYAEGILRICKLYAESRLVCVAGVTGADLRKRIESIMDRRMAVRLNRARKVMLAVAGVAALAAPVMVGVMRAPAMSAQAAGVAAPKFEVASVKPSNADPRSSSGIQTGHGRLTANNVTLKRCIVGAYGVGPRQISGGPDWLDSDRFEIVAKSEQPTDGDAALSVMLQSLLAERFKLALHRETRMMPAFVLEVGKNGPKLERAEGGESVTKVSHGIAGGSIAVSNTGIDLFANLLSREREVELPVENHTGLTGVFNFKLEWTPESDKPTAPSAGTRPEGPTIFTAIEEQLGLRLRSQKAPVDVLVIDHVERPTEN